MNNRVQQRFDRSIREAVAETARVREEERVRQRDERHRREAKRAQELLPSVVRMLETGTRLNGQRLTCGELAALRDVRRDYERALASAGTGAREEG